MKTRHAVVDTSLGSVTIVATTEAITEAITGLYFAQHSRRPPGETLGPQVPLATDRLLAEAARQLLEYLDATRRSFELPLEAAGNEFQTSVWAIVSEIPFGQTVTYGDIAERLGDRSRAQEVGQAVGMNPLCVFVPCHRVIGANGALTGYAGGLARKRALLALEEPAPVSAGRLF
jgi:methylated-DNA-[protein]-cysteine S-methyltransferase